MVGEHRLQEYYKEKDLIRFIHFTPPIPLFLTKGTVSIL
jgi:hypothetical protein